MEHSSIYANEPCQPHAYTVTKRKNEEIIVRKKKERMEKRD